MGWQNNTNFVTKGAKFGAFSFVSVRNIFHDETYANRCCVVRQPHDQHLRCAVFNRRLILPIAAVLSNMLPSGQPRSGLDLPSALADAFVLRGLEFASAERFQQLTVIGPIANRRFHEHAGACRESRRANSRGFAG